MSPKPQQRYIHVVGWDELQHGSTRTNPWIKDYLSDLRDDNYLGLTPYQRALLHDLRLAYASSGRQLRFDTTSLRVHVGFRVTTDAVESLVHAGFLELRASTEVEESKSKKRVEKNSPLVPLTGEQAAAFRILNEGVEKTGYCAAKFNHKRFYALTRQYPTLDLVAEAEKLRDWEMFGAGETKDTRDGISRLRNWLDRAAASVVVPDEIDYPLHPLSATYLAQNGES